MYALIKEHLEKLDNISKGECWYIVKQDTSFWRQCYYVKILLEYKNRDESLKTKNLEDFFKEKIEKLNSVNPELELSKTYRALRIAYFYGLISLEGSSYESAVETEVYKTILDKTNGKFENTDSYKEIILNQLEKIFISSELDDESEKIRKNYKLYPVIFLYKILLEIGISTGEYSITKDEYKYFLTVQEKYDDYLKTLTLILESREDFSIFESFKEYKNKLDNRFNLVIEQLETIKFDKEKDKYILNPDYMTHIKNLIYNIENYNILAEENYMNLLQNNINLDNETISDKRNNSKSTKIKNNSLQYQRIFFGAPGTGKSYSLNTEAREYFNGNYERVTFHSSYTYGNFVGAFKPFPKKNNDNEIITYKYVPGPLMRILTKALINKDDNYLLIVEEINRANVASVFGDFFQLLDRDISGESEYSINTSEEIKEYFKEYFFNQKVGKETLDYIHSKIGENYESLILPDNLFIWATMNSADQGVMPMDTAFRRRWDFKYIGVDDAVTKKFDEYKFKISENSIVKWNDFRTEVNKHLCDCNIPEDKLLGPYFISKKILESKDIDKITKAIREKVLMYLYEDVAKAHRNRLFAIDKAKTFSSLCKAFDENGKDIFNPPLNIKEETETSSGETAFIDKE